MLNLVCKELKKCLHKMLKINHQHSIHHAIWCLYGIIVSNFVHFFVKDFDFFFKAFRFRAWT